MKVTRGDIVYLYDYAYMGKIGNIQGGKRPLLVVSNDKGNFYSNVAIVCPLTAKNKRADLATHAKIKKGMVLCEQVFTINQNTIYRLVNHLTDEEMKTVEKCLKISLNLG